MRVWRALKSLGCGVLRDGVYLLPYRPEFSSMLQLQAKEVIEGGGSAHILTFNSEHQEQQQTFEKLFDRSTDYAQLLDSIRQTIELNLMSYELANLQKKVQRLRKDFEVIALQDFFPNAAREQTATALEDLEQLLLERFSSNEPQATHRRIKRLQRSDYQHRIWATRQRPWIDRLASAWLIRRFIDPYAHFIWISTPEDCPEVALGFDFDDATFTHVGSKVTFEVLLDSFGLTDPSLKRIGALVHYLDVGGIPVPEAVGLETLINGMQQCWVNDDELLEKTEKIFDAFYQAFSGNMT